MSNLLKLQLNKLGPFELGQGTIILQRLVSLDLTDNSFTCIPTAIIKITTLQSLNLSGNDNLQLEYRDENILAELPYLQDLILGIGFETTPDRWSFQSMRIVISLSRAFPDLDIII
jgi:hypothetical protein